MAFKIPKAPLGTPNQVTFIEEGVTKVYKFYQRDGKDYMSIDDKELPFSKKLHEKVVKELLNNPNVTILK